MNVVDRSVRWSYELGFPRAGAWREVFNSDNPQVAGNGGGIWAASSPRDRLPAAAHIVIPANSVLVFAPAA